MLEADVLFFWKVMFVIDSSAPEKVGPATIHLIELLNHPALQSSPFLLVFSKTDMKSSRLDLSHCQCQLPL
jgi:hypothetical protein